MLLFVNFLFACFPPLAAYFYHREKSKLEKSFNARLAQCKKECDERVKKAETVLKFSGESGEQIAHDLKTRGGTLVRIDMADVLYRSPRG